MYLELAQEFKASFQADVEAAQAKISKIDQMLVDFDATLVSEKEKSFNEGLEQAGQLGGEGKIYSDAELQAELDPLKEKIAMLEGERVSYAEQISALQSEVEAMRESTALAVEQKETEMKAEFHAELTSVSSDDDALKAKYAPSV